jgi:hypothetical protein
LLTSRERVNTMKTEDFITCLRKSDDSPEITALLTRLGVKKKPKMPKDDIEARINLPKQGLSLIFLPEGPKTGKLALAAVQFVSDAEEGFKTFAGALPDKLQFGDTQADVIKKLGKPSESKKKFRLDRWKTKTLVTTADYSKKDLRLSLLTVHAPEYY